MTVSLDDVWRISRAAAAKPGPAMADSDINLIIAAPAFAQPLRSKLQEILVTFAPPSGGALLPVRHTRVGGAGRRAPWVKQETPGPAFALPEFLPLTNERHTPEAPDRVNGRRREDRPRVSPPGANS